jgi:hypothetical protein
MWGDPSADTRKLGRLHLNKPADIAPSPARLFDLRDDAAELHDLAAKPEARDILLRLLVKLHTRINRNVQPQPLKDRGQYRPIAPEHGKPGSAP